MEAIREGHCLYYENRDRNNSVHKGILKPYKIMHSPQTLSFQLISAATDTSEKEPRLVLMNIDQILQMKTADGENIDIDAKDLLEQKKQEPLEIIDIAKQTETVSAQLKGKTE